MNVHQQPHLDSSPSPSPSPDPDPDPNPNPNPHPNPNPNPNQVHKLPEQLSVRALPNPTLTHSPYSNPNPNPNPNPDPNPNSHPTLTLTLTLDPNPDPNPNPNPDPKQVSFTGQALLFGEPEAPHRRAEPRVLPERLLEAARSRGSTVPQALGRHRGDVGEM